MSDPSRLPPMKPMDELPPLEEQRALARVSSWDDPEDPIRQGRFPKWHWGAFALQWVWALSHGMPRVALLAFLGSVCTASLVSGVILGLMGYRLAWEHRGFRDFEQVRERERWWSMAGLVAFCLLSWAWWVAFWEERVTLPCHADQLSSRLPCPNPLPRHHFPL